MFRLVGISCDAEYYSNRGRIDTVIYAPDPIYVIEYTYNQSAASAMEQIHLLALNYDLSTRNIGNDWIEAVL